MRFLRIAAAGALVAVAAAAVVPVAGAQPAALSGTITADGSSTVGPYTTAAAELFQKKIRGVRAFIGYVFNNEKAIANRADFISLTNAQLKKARRQFTQSLRR